MPNLPTARTEPHKAYHTGDPETEVAWAKAVESYEGIQHSLGYVSSFDNVLPGQSGRVPFERSDYEYFRPGEALPKKYRDVVQSIDTIYSSVAIVRQVIDLMSDFASEGIKIVHPVKKVERFYQQWFEKVQGQDRSERFLSGLYRHGMVCLRNFNADVQYDGIEDLVFAKNEIKLGMRDIKPNNIPVKYMFYNPAFFEHENYHEVNKKPIYKYDQANNMVKNNIFKNGYYGERDTIDLPYDRMSICYYKKDDWNPKPLPMLFPIIKHAIMIEKLNLADSAALDGAISKVRIFRLGDLDKGLIPDEGSMSKLQSILQSNTSGGSIDIIWGPDIDIVESNTEIYKFLGEEKYRPHLSQIYEGLGIPASFTGVGQGTTNNYISLKIMMRRLMSGRAKLIDFWNDQIKQVQLAMGFAQPATLEFNNLDLGDEESERQMLIQLLDRDIVSAERVQNILGFDPRNEAKRISKENKERMSGKRPQKAGAFHNPEKHSQYVQTALDKGLWVPEQAGIVRAPGTEHLGVQPENYEEVLFPELNGDESTPKPQDTEGKKGPGGRPKGSKDTQKRKTPIFKPKIKASEEFASIDFWYSAAQDKVADLLKEPLLEAMGKKSFRSTTQEELFAIEKIKFGVLSNIECFSNFDLDKLTALVDEAPEPTAYEVMRHAKESIEIKLGREPTIEEMRLIYKKCFVFRPS